MKNAKDDIAIFEKSLELEINSDHTIADWNHFCRDAA